MALIATTALLFTSCKKENSNTKDVNEAEFTQQSDDQARFTAESDEISDDINAAIESSPALQGRGTRVTALCNATISIDSISNPRTVTITYNGLNCAGTRSRTGTVVASMPAGVKWKDAGAVLTVTITNLKITRVSDGKYITLNGTKTITNVTGGRLIDLPAMGTIIHTVSSSNMSLKFDTSSMIRNWNIAKKRTFSFTGTPGTTGAITITTTGNHTIGGNNKVVEWGTNRFGNAFITSIEHPLTVRSNCNFRLTSGQVKHELLGRNLTVTFGLDAAGNPTGCPGANPYYMKLVWTGTGGLSHTVIRPY
jgi:hypothetical protein